MTEADWFLEKAAELRATIATRPTPQIDCEPIEAVLRQAYRKCGDDLKPLLNDMHKLASSLEAKCASEYKRGLKQGLLDAAQIAKGEKYSWEVIRAIQRRAEEVK